jgi:small subunit ribosomal protein S1
MSNHTLETPTQPEAGVWTTGPDGELIPDYDGTFPTINEGEVVHGTVVRVDKDEVLVDIGYKSEGVIPVAELSIRRNVNPADEVSVGDEIDALVMTKEDAEGRLLLSKKRARFELAWKAIEGAAESGEPVNGRVIEVVKGGLILDLGVRGFLPASLVDIRRVQDLDEFLGKELRCKVIELNRSRNNVVLSRRAVLEDERKEMRQAILDRLNPGDVVEGRVTKVVTFGAFVEILPGVEGLVHISELASHHVENPREVVSQGDPVNVLILEIDGDRRRLSLSLKRVEEGAVPVPRADGGESVHSMPDLRLSEEAFPSSGAAVEAVEAVEDVEVAADAGDEIVEGSLAVGEAGETSEPEAEPEAETEAEAEVEVEAEAEAPAEDEPAAQADTEVVAEAAREPEPEPEADSAES